MPPEPEAPRTQLLGSQDWQSAPVCTPAIGRGRGVTVTDRNGVPGVQCPGCTNSSYTLGVDGDAWKDALRLLFAGIHHDGTRDCNSDVRRSLAADWHTLYPTTCAGGACQELMHAWRSADAASETSAFLQRLGLGSPASNPFCNGGGLILGASGAPSVSDQLDLDPVRRTCGPKDDVCSRDGTLGLVTVVAVPSNLTAAENYPPESCTAGVVQLLQADAINIPCPNGKLQLFGKCFEPVARRADDSISANCWNAREFAPFSSPPGTDGRVYNLYAKAPNGNFKRNEINRFVQHAAYRIHGTRSPTGVTCQEQDSASQIACLLRADPCSVDTSILPPNPVPISACTTISAPGTYVVTEDLHADSDTCLSIGNTGNVTLDCQGHVVVGHNALTILNASDFAVKNCSFLPPGPFLESEFVTIRGSTRGSLSQSRIGPPGGAGLSMKVEASSHLSIDGNFVFAMYSQTQSSHVTLVNNTIATSPSDLPPAVILIELGSFNTIENNTIDGGASTLGGFDPSHGADDGILIKDETHAALIGNHILNNYDCGIETWGMIDESNFSNNFIERSSICGIGGWFGMGLRNTTLSGNYIDGSANAFAFYRVYGLRPAGSDGIAEAETAVYFTGNTFAGNVATNLTASAVRIFLSFQGRPMAFSAQGMRPGEVAPTLAQFHLVGNTFANNDFGMTHPNFGTERVAGAIVDGGNNICDPRAFPNSPDPDPVLPFVCTVPPQ